MGFFKDKVRNEAPPPHVFKVGDSAWLKCSLECAMTVTAVKDGMVHCAWHTSEFALDMGTFPAEALLPAEE